MVSSQALDLLLVLSVREPHLDSQKLRTREAVTTTYSVLGKNAAGAPNSFTQNRSGADPLVAELAFASEA